MFTRTRSVTSITAGLTKMVSDLITHAEDKEAANVASLAEAQRLLNEAAEHRAEAEKARKVSENLAALLA